MSNEKQPDRKARIVAEVQKRRQNIQNPTPPKLKLLFTVVDRQRAELYAAMIQQFGANIQLYINAQGTASSERLEYLGLSDLDKAMIVSVIREDRSLEALKFLDEKFRTIKNGKGIAFTVPFSSVIGVATYKFLAGEGEEKI